MVSHYEMRRRVMNLVIDLMGKGKEDDEILFMAYAKYGASEKMVKDMIERAESQIKRKYMKKK